MWTAGQPRIAARGLRNVPDAVPRSLIDMLNG
jgi:hypothetical protein